MSEETLKATNIKVLRIKAKDNPKAPVDLEVTDLDTGANGWMKYWPTLTIGKAKVANPACKMVQGGEYRVGVFHQTREWEGKTYTDWYIKTCEETLSGGQAATAYLAPNGDPIVIPNGDPIVMVYGDVPTIQQYSMTDKDRLIIAQVAWKEASQHSIAVLNAVGIKEWESMGGVNVGARWARDIYYDIIEIAKTGGDPFAGG